MGGPKNGGGGGRKRKRTYEKRYRRSKRRYTVGDRTKDIDQIQDNIIKIKRGTLRIEKPDVDKPGMGQFKCVICARYFISKTALTTHKKTKKHKKMLKKVSRPQYTQEEADRCGGLGREEKTTDKKDDKFKRETGVQFITVDQ